MPTPPHLRSIPPAVFDGLTDAEAAELRRETADVVTNVQRRRRAADAEAPEADRWAFDVPRDAARLFDALTAEGLGTGDPCLGLDVVATAAVLGMGEADALDALRTLAAHELATVRGSGLGASVTLHPDVRSWF